MCSYTYNVAKKTVKHCIQYKMWSMSIYIGRQSIMQQGKYVEI